MSAPPSPQIRNVSNDEGAERKDPALLLEIFDVKPPSDGRARDGSSVKKPPPIQTTTQKLYFQINETSKESESAVTRSTSATSSLDPYYFGAFSATASPVPPLPDASTVHSHALIKEPMTPNKDPASIDRRGLIGVGELATPRWTHAEKHHEDYVFLEREKYQTVFANGCDVILEDGNDMPDSPWTIEAIDGELDVQSESPTDMRPPPRPIRTRRSVASESGGEEILYPRKADLATQSKSLDPVPNTEIGFRKSPTLLSKPPSLRKAKRQTSEEADAENCGNTVSARVTSSAAPKNHTLDERTTARKHRSLGSSVPPPSPSSREKGKDRHRESLVSTATGGLKPSISSKAERHSTQTSTSSSSSNHGDGSSSRRVNTTDFSHLPPSPSSTSIQQYLRHANTVQSPPSHPISKEPHAHSSPNVAHSLLRGTQEGWSGLDDEATAEALRKLDGLSGKTARARASIGSLNRAGSISRPGTPAGKTGTHWEGMENAKVLQKSSTRSRESIDIRDKTHDHQPSWGLGTTSSEPAPPPSDLGGNFKGGNDDNSLGSPVLEKTPKKSGSTSVRSSFTPKRGSVSSTNYTSTPTTTSSSRDSTSLSVGTSATSVSTTSGRHSAGKVKRNSTSSDISVHSNDATSLKDRVAALAISSDVPSEDPVPPVPPLPKDFTNYRSPPQSSTSFVFPPVTFPDDNRRSHDSDKERTISLEVPPFSTSSPISGSSSGPENHYSRHYVRGPGSAPAVTKTPSKKWSFSNALNLISPSSSSPSTSKSTATPSSPRTNFGQQLRKSESKDLSMASTCIPPRSPWTTRLPDAMASAGSLVSFTSVGSAGNKKSPATPATAPIVSSRTPDRSRSETSSSGSTNLTTSAANLQVSLSPSSSLRRAGPSSKRLTPSSIPFFRRSSSQSMQFPPMAPVAPASPTPSSGQPSSAAPRTKKKSSVLSLGLPSLLKGSSSRRSMHADELRDAKELQRAKDARERSDAEKERRDHDKEKLEKEKSKKDDKERSESRISALMGRKRGKTLSSTEKKPQVSAVLPPMQMTALPSVTAQRVASLRSSISTSTSSASVLRSSSSPKHVASSMQKPSDASLRSTRNQLPTIAGSPSVGLNASKEAKSSPTSFISSFSGSKEAPTKIPRISSRTSATSSPPLKLSTLMSSRRTSINVSGTGASSAEPSPLHGEPYPDEFGVMENSGSPLKTTITQRTPIRGSPSASTSRAPRQSSTTVTATSSLLPRKSNRDSISFTGIRKSSTGSVASISSILPGESSHRFSALSPSKGLKLLSPKVASNASRQSSSSSSSVQSPIDEDELIGDEEMLQYIRRQQAKKLAAGATQTELDQLLSFPEPIPPTLPSTPAAILKSSQAFHLSEYERQEILDYTSVYYVGAKSKKKPATTVDSTQNHGYDDDRGDYHIVNNDHLGYRYEVIDTLGKGSFGQVLHCRDHCTGESVAIKIIRNKKRFHHQALVEIKILDNLRKWDQDEKHHVIKMTEYFYFRNHLCIAMELLSINLYELIKANGFVGFSTALIRRFTAQLLSSLSLMRHHRIVHCDLKPENVLLRHPAKSAIKVIDFGSSCFEHEKIYTYIQSRFYRSPEVILGMNYHMAIDMWSLGCILAELFTGFPIFPGENEQEQLSCIMEVLGVPEKEFINRSTRKKLFFDPSGAPRVVINSKGRRRRPGTKNLAQVLRCNDEEFVDFITKCLVWDPERRIKPQAAMRHPFVTSGKSKAKGASTAPSSPPKPSTGTRGKTITETPKKSQIGAPTPLTARVTRVSNMHTNSLTSSTSTKLYRSQAGIGPLSYHSSSRALNGLASSSAK